MEKKLSGVRRVSFFEGCAKPLASRGGMGGSTVLNPGCMLKGRANTRVVFVVVLFDLPAQLPSLGHLRKSKLILVAVREIGDEDLLS